MGRVGTGLVDDIRQHVGAICRKAFAGNRVLAQAGNEFLVGGFKLFWVGRFAGTAAGVVDDDNLDTLGSHDGTATEAADIFISPAGPMEMQ